MKIPIFAPFQPEPLSRHRIPDPCEFFQAKNGQFWGKEGQFERETICTDLAVDSGMLYIQIGRQLSPASPRVASPCQECIPLWYNCAMDRHKNPAKTIRLDAADWETLVRVKELYDCPSDNAATKLALCLVARQDVCPTAPAPNKEHPFYPQGFC